MTTRVRHTESLATLAATVVLAFPFWTRGQDRNASVTQAIGAPAAAPTPDPRQRFSGTFHYIGGDRQEALRLEAIDLCAQALNGLIRGIARDRLRDSTPIARHLTLRWTPGVMEVTYSDPFDHYRSRDDGITDIGMNPDGSRAHLWHRFENGTLRERRWTDQGARENFYMLSTDGNGVTVEVTMSSSRLPVPLRYRISYHN